MLSSADLVLFVSKGIIIPLAVCAPLAVLSAHSASVTPGSFSSNETGMCAFQVAGATSKWKSAQLGDKTYKNTSDLRCPNYNFTVDHLLAVSECYEKDGQKDRAPKQLVNFSSPKFLGGCIDEDYLAKIDNRILALKN